MSAEVEVPAVIVKAMPLALDLVSRMRLSTNEPEVAAFAAAVAAKMYASLVAQMHGRSMTQCVAECESGLRQGMEAMVESQLHSVPQPPVSTTLN